MKVLVTGATGFVGSHLIDLLDLMGHEVFSLYRNPKKLKEFEVKGRPVKGTLDNLAFIDGLPCDLDAVIHIAGLVHAPDYRKFYEVNTKYTEDLIGKLQKKYPKLIFGLVSSQAATGPGSDINAKDENSANSPVSHYGKSKLLAEEALLKGKGKWKTFIIRPPMVIGPRDPAILEVMNIVKTQMLPVVGNPSKKHYSFVCVFDLVKGISLALEQIDKACGELFYIANPKPVTYKELLETIKDVMGVRLGIWLSVPEFLLKLAAYAQHLMHKCFKSFNPKVTLDKVNEIIPNYWVVSSKKSIQVLDMAYFWDLKKTIKETIRDYKSRGWL